MTWDGGTLEDGDAARWDKMMEPKGEAGPCYTGAGNQDIEG
jgi:hypothetical protein